MEEKMFQALQDMQLNPKWCNRGWSIRCPNPHHNDKGYDKKPSAFCFADNGYIYCYSNCRKGMNINNMSGRIIVPSAYTQKPTPMSALPPEEEERRKKYEQHYIEGDFTEFWLDLEPLTESIKGIPVLELNKRGWRKYPGGALKPGLFIPYFNEDKSKVIYAQIRHTSGEQRFSFPTAPNPNEKYRQHLYGLEQFAWAKGYIAFTEGSSDALVLGVAGIPAVSVLNAGAANLLNEFGQLCAEKGLQAVAICDTDKAGQELLDSADFPYIDARVSEEGCKDIADVYEKFGVDYIKQKYKDYWPIENAVEGL